METCTPFCGRLHTLVANTATPPSRVALDSVFEPWKSDLSRGLALGTFQELQSRNCPFCQLAGAAVAHTVTDAREVNADQLVEVVLFPEETGFRLSFPSRLGTQLAFVAADESQVQSPDCARVVGSSYIRPETISDWLHKCDNNHTGCVLNTRTEGDRDRLSLEGPFGEVNTSNFRVLDLEAGCIGRVPLHTRYVTLSYVWGQYPMFQLLRGNFDTLSAPGGLDTVFPNLPKTIRDAITLVKSVGERYLWVDALCLLQDDKSDVKLGIELMNSIYQGSYFTLVAAAGADSNSGLPGFQEARDPSSQIVRELIPGGLRMSVIHSIDWHIEKSIYSSRGWTMQELVLPRRTVLFINNQVYFRCHEANWSEETWSDKYISWIDPDDSNISRIPELSEGRVRSLWVYQKLCEDYSRRTLRNDGDALRAVAGISRPLFAGMRTIGTEGLPGYFLDMFLLFTAPECRLRRRPEFASFSWAGWQGKILWPRENYVAHDEDGETSWDPENIAKHFATNRLVDWTAWPRKKGLRELTYVKYGSPPTLKNLLLEFPSLFPGGEMAKGIESWVEVDSMSDPDALGSKETKHDLLLLGMDSAQNMLPDTDKVDDEEALRKAALGLDSDEDKFFRKAPEALNSQVEFERLIERISPTKNGSERKYLQNWLASRAWKIRQFRDTNKVNVPFSTGQNWQREHYFFRKPRYPIDSPENFRKQQKDKRVEAMKAHLAAEGTSSTDTKGLDMHIPNFPPYTVLCFQSVTFHLALGESPPTWYSDQPRPHSMPADFHALQDIALRSSNGDVVGSLHPDNLDFVGPAGSKIELMVVSRCQTLTGKSALWQSKLVNEASGEAINQGPLDLLWVLFIVWDNGIAERRGVGQVLKSALVDSIEPKPEVKHILLG